MKNIMVDIKTSIGMLNSKLDKAEEGIYELEHIHQHITRMQLSKARYEHKQDYTSPKRKRRPQKYP